MTLFVPITKIDKAKRLVYGRLSQEVPDKSGEILDYATSKPAFQKWSDEQFKASGGKSKGNLRAMHDKIAAGIFTDITFDDENLSIEGCAKVVDDAEWLKVETGTYTGFSIGGGYAKRWPDPDNPSLKRFTPNLTEVSLVDNPCVPTATFEFIKEDGSTELRKFNTKQEAPMTKESTTTGDAPKATDTTNENHTPTTTEAPAEKANEADELAKDAGATEQPAEPRDGHPADKGGVVQGFQARDGSFHVRKSDALQRNSEIDATEAAAPALAALEKLDAAASAVEATLEKKDPADAAAGELAKTADEPEAEDKPADTPAEPAEKAAEAEVKKGMYGVSRFAELLSSIQCLQQDTAWEAEYEGDDSALPGKLKAWLAEGGKLLVQMTREETAELTATKDAGGDSLAKRSNDALSAENTALKKALGDMTPKLEGLLTKFEQCAQTIKEQNERIAHLESQPAAPKGALRVVEKTNDGGNDSDGDIVNKFNQHLDTLPAAEKSKLLMKVALANPVAVQQ